MFVITATTTSITIYLYYSVVESNFENVLHLSTVHSPFSAMLDFDSTTIQRKIL